MQSIPVPVSKYIVLNFSKTTPNLNYIGIRKSVLRRHYSVDDLYAANVLITIFDMLYKLNPRYWQRANSEPYEVECLNNGDVRVRSGQNPRVKSLMQFLFISSNSSFYVSSMLTCKVLSDYVYNEYNRRPKIINLDSFTKRYIYNIIQYGQ